jgi:hypothetical protein
MTEQYQYRVYCCTESNFIDSWLYDAPITCPNNYKHTIDSNQIYKFDQRYVGRTNAVMIKQEETQTQGLYRYECINYNITSNPDQIHDTKFNYPVNLLSAKIITSETHRGDIINYDVIPPPPIGLLTSNVNIGDSNFNVDNTVLSIMKKGYHMVLLSSNNHFIEDLGEVIDKNIPLNILTTQFASSNNYPAGVGVHMDVNSIKNLTISEPNWYSIVDSRFTGAYLPNGVTLRLRYQNSNLQPKSFSLHTQYLY